MTGDHDDLIAMLAQVNETIDERALEALRDAVASGAERRPESERHLSQARRAIEKAIHALQRAADG